MTDSPLSDQEAKLLALSFAIVNEWATQFLNMDEGKQTKEEAYDKFNEYLVPIGELLAIVLNLPGVEAQILDMHEEAQNSII